MKNIFCIFFFNVLTISTLFSVHKEGIEGIITGSDSVEDILAYIDLNCINDLVENVDDTLLHLACWFHRKSIVEYLVKNGADVNKRNNNCGRDTPLSLLTDKVLINSKNYPGTKEALTKSFKEIAKILLDNGAYINCQNAENGYTVLHTAVRYYQNLEVIEFLLENGADVTIRTFGKRGQDTLWIQTPDYGNATSLELAQKYQKDIEFKEKLIELLKKYEA